MSPCCAVFGKANLTCGENARPAFARAGVETGCEGHRAPLGSLWGSLLTVQAFHPHHWEWGSVVCRLYSVKRTQNQAPQAGPFSPVGRPVPARSVKLALRYSSQFLRGVRDDSINAPRHNQSSPSTTPQPGPPRLGLCSSEEILSPLHAHAQGGAHSGPLLTSARRHLCLVSSREASWPSRRSWAELRGSAGFT